MIPDDERPRWSFTWLLRIQRVGRNRRDPEDDGTPVTRSRLVRWIVIVILAGIVLIEIAIGIWLGILPRL